MTRGRIPIGIAFALLNVCAAAHAGQPLDAPAFSLSPPAQRAADDALPVASRADATQIERLMAAQQPNPGHPATPPSHADTATDISDCVDQNIRTVDPANPNWNDKDPRWAPMRQMIAHDCAERQAYRLNVIEPKLQRMYRDALAQSYAQRVSRRDADVLIGFYATDMGHRFQAFQARLTAVEFNSMRQVGLGRDQNGNASAPPATPATPPPDVMKHRAAILLMSRQMLVMVQWQKDAVRTGGDTSGGAVAPIMMSMAATMQGDAVDQIEKEFARELPTFSAFLSSSAEKNEIRALADAQLSFGQTAATQLIKPAMDWNSDFQKWLKQYRALPTPASAPAAGAPPAK